MEDKDTPGEIKPDNPWPRPDKNRSKFAINRKQPLSEEMALPHVLKLLDRYDIDVESPEIEDEKAVNEKILNNLLSAVRGGHVEVLDIDGQVKVIQHIQHLSPDSSIKDGKLIYDELTGEHQDKMPVGDNVSKIAQIDHVMGMLTGRIDGVEIVKKLRSADRKVMQIVGAVFLLL